jgi:hypothetical protein
VRDCEHVQRTRDARNHHQSQSGTEHISRHGHGVSSRPTRPVWFILPCAQGEPKSRAGMPRALDRRPWPARLCTPQPNQPSSRARSHRRAEGGAWRGHSTAIPPSRTSPTGSLPAALWPVFCCLDRKPNVRIALLGDPSSGSLVFAVNGDSVFESVLLGSGDSSRSLAA